MKQLLLLLLLLVSISCQSDLEDIETNKILVATPKYISIPLDQNTSHKPKVLKSFTNTAGQSFIYIVNKKENSIQKYDISNNTWTQKINIDKEGANGVGRISGLTIKSEQSIYVSASGVPILFLVDTIGRIIEKYDYRKITTKGYAPVYSSLRSKYNVDVFNFKSKIVLTQPLYVNGRTTNTELLKHHKTFLTIDTQTKNHEMLSISFPKDYFKKGYFPISSISSAGDGSQLAFSLPCDHHIYFTKDGNNLDRKIAKSKYIDEFVPKGGNPYEYFAENPFYGSLYFDPYRNLFFRIVKHPYKKAAELGINHCYDYPPAFSIQILDNEFNLLGEQKINGLKYSMYVLFIHPDGIYISSSNPKNDNTKEDKLDFQLFEIHDVFDKS